MEITWRVITGEKEGRVGEKVQGIRSINGRYKIDSGGEEWYRKCRTQRTLMYNPGHEVRGKVMLVGRG